MTSHFQRAFALFSITLHCCVEHICLCFVLSIALHSIALDFIVLICMYCCNSRFFALVEQAQLAVFAFELLALQDNVALLVSKFATRRSYVAICCIVGEHCIALVVRELSWQEAKTGYPLT